MKLHSNEITPNERLCKNPDENILKLIKMAA
jgi:hypothetical protein